MAILNGAFPENVLIKAIEAMARNIPANNTHLISFIAWRFVC
jgi:hypothetical protein